MGWLDGFRDKRLSERIVQHNDTTGRLQVNAVDVDPYEYTWAEFILLTSSDFAGINVRVTDRHQDSRGVGGVLFVGGATWTILNGGHVYYSTLAAAIAEVPAASWSGIRIFPGDVGAPMQSDGTSYLIDGGESIISRSAVAQRVLSPAATFTAVTPTSAAAGADTLLTSAGVHGLTTAICVTAGVSYIYISAGTNWTVGLHKINAIAVDTTGVTIQIDTPWNAGFGTPTIALAGTAFVIKTLTIPPMTPNGGLELAVTWGSTSGAGSKRPLVYFGATGSGTGGTAYYNPATITNTRLGIRPNSIIIQNQNSVSSQTGAMASDVQSLIDITNTVLTTSSVTTSSSTDLSIGALMASANDPIWIACYTLKLRT